MASEQTYPTIRGAMTAADVAELAGVAEATIRYYHSHQSGDLPDPKAILAGRPIWEHATIKKWVANRRGPGRPASKAKG